MTSDALPDAPPFFTGRIAGWSRGHRRLVMAVWLLVALLTIGSCVAIGPDEDLEDSGTGESGEAADLFDDRFDEDSLTASETIIFDHPTLTVDDPVYQQTVTDLLAEIRSLRALNTEIVGGTEVASSTPVFAQTAWRDSDSTQMHLTRAIGTIVPEMAPLRTPLRFTLYQRDPAKKHGVGYAVWAPFPQPVIRYTR